MSGAAAAAGTLLLLAFFAWYLRGRRLPGPRRLEVVERVAVAPNRLLAVVRAGSRCWLLGVSSGGEVQPIAELDASEWSAAADNSDAVEAGSAQSNAAWRSVLSRLRPAAGGR